MKFKLNKQEVLLKTISFPPNRLCYKTQLSTRLSCSMFSEASSLHFMSHSNYNLPSVQVGGLTNTTHWSLPFDLKNKNKKRHDITSHNSLKECRLYRDSTRAGQSMRPAEDTTSGSTFFLTTFVPLHCTSTKAAILTWS